MVLQFVSWLPWAHILTFVLGAVFICVIQGAFLFIYFVYHAPNHHNLSNPPSVDAYTFPQQLLELISEKIGDNTSEGTVLLNLLLQFWFHENRYDTNTLAAIGNRLNSELTELLTNTSLGKVFSSLKVHDIELGSESPTISSVSLKNVDMNKDRNMLNNFAFEFDISYVGGFYMSIDTVMKFSSNTAFVSVKVAKCIGKVRVEFTRLPYTYWYMSFLQQPELELNVESRLEGHSVPQLNRIIGIQLRRRINRKFVMPYYKIRTKPFLPAYDHISFKDNINEAVPNGVLSVTLLSLSRLQLCQSDVSCTLIVDNNPWIDDAQSVTSYSHILQLFKRSKQDMVVGDIRKLSTGSMFVDRHQDGLRQRFRSMTGQEELYSLDEIMRRKSFTDTIHVTNKSNSDNLETSNIQHTKRLPHSEYIVFNESFKFNIGPQFRFLNILVWNHPTNNVNSSSLIGFICVPLATEICTTGIGRKCRIFYLRPPGPTRNTVYPALSSHPGFNPSLCYGDITIAVKIVPASATLSHPSMPTDGTPSPTKPPKDWALLEAEENLKDVDTELIFNAHEFEKTNMTTKLIVCEYCSKKIWFKDAFKCSKCGYMCHKKCVTRCVKTTECHRIERSSSSDQLSMGEEALDLATSVSAATNPEIIMTSPDNVSIISGKNKFTSFFANVKGVRRTESASNLAPSYLLQNGHSQSLSLPQTPGHSPSISRKASVSCDVELFQSVETEKEIEKALSLLLAMPQNEQILESVKNSGRKLCSDLSPIDRELRINEMITKIKLEIDAESEKCADLHNQTKVTNEDSESARLAFQIGKSEERLQALTNLLLHCCSGLQDFEDSTAKIIVTPVLDTPVEEITMQTIKSTTAVTPTMTTETTSTMTTETTSSM